MDKETREKEDKILHMWCTDCRRAFVDFEPRCIFCGSNAIQYSKKRG